ncbi:hypothetical protein B0H10DRAFT_2223287 [Mycena sp. CBHHK59/15]|nr:hypothetical protein B0H10DRAFT_2223287 [Mycena sp. CBHHK59/15]
MSFGTVFWPTAQEYVDEVIEALLEENFPFILCHASPFAKIFEELSEKVKNSGIGLLATWAPQQFILNHPVSRKSHFYKMLFERTYPTGKDGSSRMATED